MSLRCFPGTIASSSWKQGSLQLTGTVVHSVEFNNHNFNYCAVKIRSSDRTDVVFVCVSNIRCAAGLMEVETWHKWAPTHHTALSMANIYTVSNHSLLCIFCHWPLSFCTDFAWLPQGIGCRRSIVVRTLVSAGELSLSCARLVAGWVTTLQLSRPLSFSQHGQLSHPSLRSR